MFLIIPNLNKENSLLTLEMIEKYLLDMKLDYKIIVDNNEREKFISYRKNKEQLTNNIFIYSDVKYFNNIAIVLGGDGSILNANRKLNYEIPLIGINHGNLGYLTEYGNDNYKFIIDNILKKNYIIEKRFMICTKINNNVYNALNEIVVRTKNTNIIEFELKINGEYINEFKADGILISTPTGSTAYNLSAGGPIALPSSEIMIITPICAHTLMNRSIVATSNDNIEIFVKTNAIVSCDGENIIELEKNTSINILKSNKNTSIIKINKTSFYKTLREKLIK